MGECRWVIFGLKENLHSVARCERTRMLIIIIIIIIKNCVHPQSAGELSGDGRSHIHCNSTEGKPPTDIHQVRFTWRSTGKTEKKNIHRARNLDFRFGVSATQLPKNDCYKWLMSFCPFETLFFFPVSAVCREMELDNLEQRSYRTPYDPALLAALSTCDLEKKRTVHTYTCRQLFIFVTLIVLYLYNIKKNYYFL